MNSFSNIDYSHQHLFHKPFNSTIFIYFFPFSLSSPFLPPPHTQTELVPISKYYISCPKSNWSSPLHLHIYTPTHFITPQHQHQLRKLLVLFLLMFFLICCSSSSCCCSWLNTLLQWISPPRGKNIEIEIVCVCVWEMQVHFSTKTPPPIHPCI